jgi:hypothetical protein
MRILRARLSLRIFTLSLSSNSQLPLPTSLHCYREYKQSQKKMAFASINSSGAPIAAIEEAFATEPSLKKRVYDAIGA